MKILVRQGERCVVVPAEGRMLLSEAIRLAGIPHDMPCGGSGRCGKCRVRVSGAVSALSARERGLLAGANPGERLSCLAWAEGDCAVEVRSEGMDAVTAGQMPRLTDEPMGSNLGAAVDIGTTTVAVYLYDFAAGALLAQETFKNPQGIYGADVISRIQAEMDGQGEHMQRLIAGSIERTLVAMLEAAGRSAGEVDAMVVTGNATMLSLLARVSCAPLSHAPFALEEFFGRSLRAEEVGFSALSCAVYLPRAVSAFVGSDITCAMLSSDFSALEGPAILCDIGTNGEMAIVRDGARFACSTAAGPAFEGAGIAFGSVAKAGAIDRVWLEDGRVRCTTLYGAPAVGLCGSGLIDAVAAFLDAGLIDETGLIDEENEVWAGCLCQYEDQPALRLGESGVLLTQKDVRAVQLAKSAVCSGLESLMQATGTRPEEVRALLIAGGFGAFLDRKSAARIGLIPRALADKASAVGNAAGMGALKLLLGKEYEKESVLLASNTQVLDLSTSPYFMERYVENMMFEG